MQIESYKLEDLSSVAEQLVLFCKDVNVWCFDAEMGAGKTTLIKEIGKQLGVKSEMSSPTFPIINEYERADSSLLYHFDCYRLESLEEAINIGIEEYLFSGNICLIEWYQVINNILPSEFVKIEIKFVEETLRTLNVKRIRKN